MKAVSAQMQAGREAGGNGVVRRGLGHVMVECRVEHGYVPRFRQRFPCRFNTRDSGGIVKRGQFGKFADFGQDADGDPRRLEESWPSVNDPMTDCIYSKRLIAARWQGDQPDNLMRRLARRANLHRSLAGRCLRPCEYGQARIGFTDALNLPASQDFLRLA